MERALEASDVKALVYNYLCRCGYAKTAARYVKESSFSPEESNAPEEDLLFIYGYYKENYCPPIPVKKEKSSKKRKKQSITGTDQSIESNETNQEIKNKKRKNEVIEKPKEEDQIKLVKFLLLQKSSVQFKLFMKRKQTAVTQAPVKISSSSGSDSSDSESSSDDSDSSINEHDEEVAEERRLREREEERKRKANDAAKAALEWAQVVHLALSFTNSTLLYR